MEDKYAGIYTQQFGVEIEMTGITRRNAAEVIRDALGGKLFSR